MLEIGKQIYKFAIFSSQLYFKIQFFMLYTSHSVITNHINLTLSDDCYYFFPKLIMSLLNLCPIFCIHKNITPHIIFIIEFDDS